MTKKIYLTRSQVMSWGQFRDYTLNKLRREDATFPKPSNFGGRQLRWDLDELEAWAKKRTLRKPILSSNDPETEWIYLPGRTATVEADRKSWVRKSGNLITVAVNGKVSEAYEKSLVEFCALHGVKVPADGSRVNFKTFDASEIAAIYLDSGFTTREIVSLLNNENHLRQRGFAKSESDEIRKALHLVLSARSPVHTS